MSKKMPLSHRRTWDDVLIQSWMPTPHDITTEEEAELRLKNLGCCFMNRNGGRRAGAAMFFVLVSEAFVRVWSWYIVGWDHLVISDVNWTDRPNTSKWLTTFVINIACVLHGLFISLLICMAIRTLNKGVPKELQCLQQHKKAFKSEYANRARLAIPELVLTEKKMWRRLGVFLLTGGLLFTAMRAVFSFDAILHRDLKSSQGYVEMIKGVLQEDTEARFPFSLFIGQAHFQMFLVIPQQMMVGALVSCLVSVIGLCTWHFIREVKDVLTIAKQNVQELSEPTAPPITASDLDDIAALLADAQRKLKIAQSTDGAGLFLIIGIAFPFIEIFYWVFLLSQLSVLGDAMNRSDHNVGWAAVNICLVSLSLLCFLVQYLSKNTSLCESILEELQNLRIKSPIQGKMYLQHPMGVDVLAAPDLQAKITSIEMYIRGQNSGYGMGMSVLGQRMTLTLFKTLILAYGSLITIFRKDFFRFFVGSS